MRISGACKSCARAKKACDEERPCTRLRTVPCEPWLHFFAGGNVFFQIFSHARHTAYDPLGDPNMLCSLFCTILPPSVGLVYAGPGTRPL